MILARGTCLSCSGRTRCLQCGKYKVNAALELFIFSSYWPHTDLYWNVCNSEAAEEVRHASQNADSALPFFAIAPIQKGHAESAFRDACRTSSGEAALW